MEMRVYAATHGVRLEVAFGLAVSEFLANRSPKRKRK